MVFPGGTYDVYRPTRQANVADFNGRTGYVRLALNAGVPVVSIGGQENQFFLTHGTILPKALRLDQFARTDVLPISFGVPFGFSAMLPLNLPLPTKIVMQVLPAIDPSSGSGGPAALADVDTRIRGAMQAALDEPACKRRLR